MSLAIPKKMTALKKRLFIAIKKKGGGGDDGSIDPSG
jgi:hypothetical protein